MKRLLPPTVLSAPIIAIYYQIKYYRKILKLTYFFHLISNLPLWWAKTFLDLREEREEQFEYLSVHQCQKQYKTISRLQ
jgi:hypothetical protein